MSILVTGATGFLGAELTRQLVREGARVRILCRRTSRLDLLGEAATHVEVAEGDVTDPTSLPAALHGIRQVYHVAGYVGMGGRRDRERLFRVNVRGTAHVVDAALAAGVERLVHTSSIAALGSPAIPQDGDALLDETATWQPGRSATVYGWSKYQAELEIHRGIAEGLDAVIVNPSLIFGPGRPGENTMRIVERVRRGTLPGIPPGGTNVVDVADVAAGHRLAMARGRTGARYILGSENLSWAAILSTLAEAFGVEPPRFRIPGTLLMASAVMAEATAWLTRHPSPLTRETARTAIQTRRYSNARAVRELGCTFRPFRNTAARLAAVLNA
ncbi:MAG: SDR family NAD(P)-dependent oxidoreductase [Bacteroidetes bacterium]|nr:MAG: SDR family NAD(P)-dependent oxidoreductase [Bacteroidota bacterium]